MRNILHKIKTKLHDIRSLNLYKHEYELTHRLINDNARPPIFTKFGEPIFTCFLRDTQFAHSPYGFGKEHIHWDRFNSGLPVHFYTHNEMLHCLGKPTRRYGWLIESECIVPDDYKIFNKYKGLHKDFDAIFTHSEIILNSVKNAKFVPAGNLWYGTKFGGGILTDTQYTNKNKLISMVSSNKLSCNLHRQRYIAAQYFKYNSQYKVDAMGTFDAGEMIKISQSLHDYMYSIVIENCVSPLFFTEKILNCFASMTIPVYYGAQKISEFFNSDGIIILTSPRIDDIKCAIRQCSEADYINRLDAIVDNYNRVFEFSSQEQYIRRHYLEADRAVCIPSEG